MFIVHATLLSIDGVFSNDEFLEGLPTPTRLAGTTITSLTHVRNPLPGKFLFIFNDLSIRQEGKYRLKFRMYEVLSDQGLVLFRAETVSSIITAYSPKNFPGLGTSSDLIKEIAQQGHRVRVRKESTLNKRRKRSHLDQISEALSISNSTSHGEAQDTEDVPPWNESPIHNNQDDTSQATAMTQKSPLAISNPEVYSEHNSPINVYDIRDPYPTQLQTNQLPNAALNMNRDRQMIPTHSAPHEAYPGMIHVSLIPMVPTDGNPNMPPVQPITQPNINPNAYIYLNNPQPHPHPYIQ